MSSTNWSWRVRAVVAVAAVGALAALFASASGSRAATVPRPQLLRAAAGSAFSAAMARHTQSASAGCGNGSTQGLICTEVDVPLDRTGQVPGTVALHVEELPAQGTPRGAMFLVAGGPGQGSAHVFDLGTPDDASFYRLIFPGYTLVAYDDRGTGASGLLDCPAVQTAVSSDNESALAADCAAKLGPGRAFYGTADHVEDLDAVRQALGLDKVGIWGVSYGTKLALAYASAHPTHVERLLLDSVVPPDIGDPFRSYVLRAMPTTLAAYCPGTSCRSATPDYSADVVGLANKLGANALTGKVRAPSGKLTTERMKGVDFLGLVVDADLNPGLAAELPAAVHAALQGRPLPLLRLYELDNLSNEISAEDLSFALYLATICRDGPFPWPSSSDVAGRTALVQQAVSALPSGTFGPFGSWARSFGDIDSCIDWPSPTGGTALGAGPLPNVPVLALSGGIDLRTPTANAAAVVAKFPQGHLLVVPGVGHSVVTADPSGCSQLAVRSWILSNAAPGGCERPSPYVGTLGAFPAATPKHLSGAATRALVSKTLGEAEGAWLLWAFAGMPAKLPGLAGGFLTPAAKSFKLTGYALANGVTLTGRVTDSKVGPPMVFKGSVTVGGTAAAHGVLKVDGATLSGKLGRKK